MEKIAQGSPVYEKKKINYRKMGGPPNILASGHRRSLIRPCTNIYVCQSKCIVQCVHRRPFAIYPIHTQITPPYYEYTRYIYCIYMQQSLTACQEIDKNETH